MASGMWFGQTFRQSQAKLVKQQHTGILPSHVPEAVPYCPHIMNVILRGRCSTYKSDQARAMVSHARGPEFESMAWNYTIRLEPMANRHVIFRLTVSLDKGLLYPPRVGPDP